MKKILFISHGLSNGGLQRVAALISNGFIKKGYEVTYISAYSNEVVYKLDEKVKNIYLKTTHDNKLLNYFQRCKMIYKITKDEQPNVIISFIYWETILLLFYKKARKIYSLRNAPIFFGKLRLFIIKILFNNSDCVVFQTLEAMESFNKKIQNKSCIIENPITENLPLWDKDNHDKIIVTAARLEKQKNLKMLIDGFKCIHKKHSDYQLYIYGKGSLYDELNSYIIENNMDKYVRIEGFINNVHDCIANSAIFALTSDYEGISNSMIEALGIGVPTICTDCPVGGARMFIKNNFNGILIPVGDTSELVKAIDKIIEDKEFANKISKNAIKIRGDLSESKIMDKWEKII